MGYRARGQAVVVAGTGPGAFRFALALVVFASHVSRYNIGRPAVLLFFILSGYWVAKVYVERSGSIAAYLVSRWLRIWPLLALTTLAWLAAMPLFGLARFEGPWSTLAILGLASRPHEVLVVAWSLDIELQFYLLLPVALVLAAWLGRRGRWAVGVAVGVASAAGLALLANGVWTVLAFAPLFAAGAAIQRTGWSPTQRQAAASLSIFVLAGVLFAALPTTRQLLVQPPADWLDIVGHTLWALTLVPFIAWNVRRRSGRVDRALGDMSYPFYLVHLPIIVALATVPGYAGGGIEFKLAVLGIAVALTVLLYRVVDRPLDRWRRRLATPVAGASPQLAVTPA